MQVRGHTVPGGGHGNEILQSNIEGALTNLKLRFEGWPYTAQPEPQAPAYLSWLKQQLAAGRGLVLMIMLAGGNYPVYPGLAPYGFYSHVEPFYGIFSNHPLNDTAWYPDDYVRHSTNADPFEYFRRFDSLVAWVSPANHSLCAQGSYQGWPCVYERWGFGWALLGLADDKDGPAQSLDVGSSFEPDTVTGSSHQNFTGTLTVTGLLKGVAYDIFRWNSAESAFDYAQALNRTSFVAMGDSFVFVDSMPIPSNTATYYRCLPAAPRQFNPTAST